MFPAGKRSAARPSGHPMTGLEPSKALMRMERPCITKLTLAQAGNSGKTTRPV